MAENPQSTNSSNNSVSQNIARVREQISEACKRCGRDSDDVRLVAVSKTKKISVVHEAIKAGQIDFGENQLQDALTKIPHTNSENINWHYIGPLQSNKAKSIPGNFNWWHTLNRFDIAQRVSNKAREVGNSVNALIQINVVNDPAKSGIASDELAPLIDQLLKDNLDGINLRGLMTIGPHDGSDVELRQCFAELRRLLETNRDRFDLANFDQLSMGMTGDMAAAIAEGATIVRIGSAIFGSRITA